MCDVHSFFFPTDRAPSSSGIACLQDDAAGDQARCEPHRQHSRQPIDPAVLCSTWDSIASGKALGMKREEEKLRDCKSARKVDESDGLRAVCKGVQCES